MSSATGTSPDDLRARMVESIVNARPTSPRVAEAMRAVARHAFVPAAPVEQAYDDVAVITKRAADGTHLSCASVPSLVAVMLDKLDVQPGHRILEIGAGTGYNAALLAYLTGPTGHVTTVDIDPDVTTQARHALDANGYQRVEVITADGALGAPEQAPYDRIIVTVGAWDLPTAWWDQLAPHGRLVVPLRWRGQTRAIAFTRTDSHWRSDWVELCGFVPMIGQNGEHSGAIDADGQVRLYWDEDQPIDPAALHGVLDQPKATAWSGVIIGPNEPFDGVWLRLTATEAGTCRIAAEASAVESGRCTPAIASRSPAIVEEDSLAYFTLRRLDDESGKRHWELGAIGHGPGGDHLANRLSEHIRAWDRDRTAEPVVSAYPATAPSEQLLFGPAINKPCIRMVVSY